MAQLHERTEGWAAGVQLAALSLRGNTDPAGFVATFSGSHRYVMDYLTEEVLARQTEDVVSFLLETSVLDRLCGPLCDAVTGRTDGQEMLERLEAADLFMIPLDEERRWWRYHQLFAELLRVRLQHERGGRASDLHRAAAAWHEAHENADEAIRHAAAAGEVVWAARLIEMNVEGLLRRSEGATSPGGYPSCPRKHCARGHACAWLEPSRPRSKATPRSSTRCWQAEGAFTTVGDQPHQPSVDQRLSVLTNIPAAISFLRADLARLRGDADAAVTSDETALGYLSEHEWLMNSHVRWNLGVVEWLRGRLGRAERSLAGVFAERRAAGEGYSRCESPMTSVRCSARGRLGAALDTYRLGLLTTSENDHELPAAGMAHVGLAALVYEQGELDAAMDHALRGGH